MEQIVAKSLVSVPNGIFLELDAVRDDFWVYLGRHVGWACFSQVVKRWTDVGDPLLFEIIEIRPPHMQEPSPLFLIGNVLWRGREAIAAHERTKAMGRGLRKRVLG